MSEPTKDEVEEAQRVLRRNYYAAVNSEAADLIRAYYNAEFSDEDGMTERLDQLELIYTSEQHVALYASDNSDEGLSRAVDGLGARGKDVIAWGAIEAYRLDVGDVLRDNELLETPMGEDLDADDRLAWLAGHHGRFLHSSPGQAVFLVGSPNAGERGEVDLGVVFLDTVPVGERRLPTLKAGRQTTGSLLDELLPQAKEMRRAGGGAYADFLLEHALLDGQLYEAAMQAAPEDRERLIEEAALRTYYAEPVTPSSVGPAEEPEYTLDGERSTLTELLRANYLLADDVMLELLQLRLGQETTLGGGAGGETQARRVA